MNADKLRSLQAPLKEKYRQTPDAALVTHTVSGRVGEDVTFNFESWAGTVRAGLHPAAGGDGSHACSGDIMLQALIACAGVTLNAVATAMGITLRGGEIRAEGDLDYRGTLGVDKTVPIGFKAIRLTFRLDTDADDQKIASLVSLTERYCVVFQTLKNPPTVTATTIRA